MNRFAYVISDSFLKKIQNIKTFSNSLDSRFISGNVGDSAVFYFMDFSKIGMCDMKAPLLKNVIIDKKSRTGLETSFGYDFYIDNELDTLEFDSILVNGELLSTVILSEQITLFTTKMSQFCLFNNGKPQVYIESPSDELITYVIIGKKSGRVFVITLAVQGNVVVNRDFWNFMMS